VTFHGGVLVEEAPKCVYGLEGRDSGVENGHSLVDGTLTKSW